MSATSVDTLEPIDIDVDDGDNYFHITGSFEMEVALCGKPLMGEMYVREDDDDNDICPTCEQIHNLLKEKNL